MTTISVYRGKSSVIEYFSAGALAGSLYKFNTGLRGMAVGGILGCGLGGLAGIFSLVVLKASGTSMEEVRYWQYNWKQERDQNKLAAELVSRHFFAVLFDRFLKKKRCRTIRYRKKIHYSKHGVKELKNIR